MSTLPFDYLFEGLTGSQAASLVLWEGFDDRDLDCTIVSAVNYLKNHLFNFHAFLNTVFLLRSCGASPGSPFKHQHIAPSTPGQGHDDVLYHA